jgi:glyoxylase-like metal-dependent hydrolase (beta-lactamase superfamily II)
MASDTYEIYAVRYAHHDRRAHENFLQGDLHDTAPMPLDYFVWAVVGESRTFILDTGFDAAMAQKRGRDFLRPPGDGLKAIGIDPDSVKDVVISHMHYDHTGNNDLFPNATYHLQDREMRFCTGRCMCHPQCADPSRKPTSRRWWGGCSAGGFSSMMVPTSWRPGSAFTMSAAIPTACR